MIHLLAELPFIMPEWAVSDEAQAWVCGFFLMATVRIFRACLRWFKRAGRDGGGSSGD